MKRIVYIILLIFSAGVVQAQTPEEMWTKGNEAYAAGDYAEAAAAYHAIENTGYVSADLYYNLGNVYYKQQSLGKAVLYYERALKLHPEDKDIAYNLEMARSMTTDKIETVPEFFVTTWIRNIHSMAGADTWAWLSILLLAAGLLFAGLFFFARRVALRKISFFIALLSVLLCAGSFWCAGQQKSALSDRSEAIIFPAVVTVKSSPDSNGKDLFILHEGTKVVVLETLGDWLRIQLADGRQGWLMQNTMERI